MKKIINKATILTVIFIAIGLVSSAQISKKKKAQKDTEAWKYEIECVGIGKPGTKVVKVWSYSKKANVAENQSKKNAVHGMVFQGYSGGGQGCTNQKALITDPSVGEQKKEFFDNFFDINGGKYMKFVSHSSDATPEIIKVSMKGYKYKVGVIVTVNTNALRKDLEAAGVVKGLSSGF
tara:strand:+ start:4545 stop:5078 length:534 start_codon:yes stop_codon:yes gene_type:complete